MEVIDARESVRCLARLARPVSHLPLQTWDEKRGNHQWLCSHARAGRWCLVRSHLDIVGAGITVKDFAFAPGNRSAEAAFHPGHQHAGNSAQGSAN